MKVSRCVLKPSQNGDISGLGQPTPEQENLLRRTLGCVRLVYNKALHERTQAWYERTERIDYCQTSTWLISWKKQKDLDFLNEVSCVPLQQSLRHLQKAFSNFFGKTAKYPRFKKKRSGGSAEFTKSAFKWKNNQVWLAKCSEPLAIRWSRQLPVGSNPSTITIKLDGRGRWFVSLLVRDETIQALPLINKSIGIDVGITSLITTSDGVKISNPKHFNKLYKKLKQVQKAYSRTQKGSSNQEKARLKVARVHAQIADSRKDFLHKLTTQLIRENQTIVIEDLAVRNMVSQRAGRVSRLEATGEPVRVKNPKLALSISDCGWSQFVGQLEYKCRWYSRELVKIDRFFPSSKRCGNCGHVMNKMPLNMRKWKCPKCHTVHDRDLNASRNILAAGLAVTVCGADVRPNIHEGKGQLRKPMNGKETET